LATRLACAAALVAAGCSSSLRAEPPVIPPQARVPYEEAARRFAAARAAGGESLRAELVAALAAAREARARAPEDFRIAALEQDLEFALDARAARERGAALPKSTASEKTLAARALLPERTDEAHDLLLAACEQDPRFAWARYGLAFIERLQGRFDDALRDAERALELDPSLVEALRLLAELYESGGDREHAVRARELLIEVSGGDLEERHRYAQLLLDADDRSDATDAEKELRVILAALGDPPGPAQREFARDALVDLGTAYARRSRFAEAIVYWRQALALDPDCLTAIYNIGVAEELKPRPDLAAALAAFEEYLARAQSMGGPLPFDQVYYRYFAVPRRVLELRQKLGLPTPAAAEEPAAAAAEPEAAR
jgi:tetratricopeptide (TPR) repeat protein